MVFFEQQLDDVLVFELPTFLDVEAFADSFGGRWPTWSYVDHELRLFAIDLTTRVSDLPVLLREVGELVAELGLAAVDFRLDGRAYLVLASHARQPVATTG